MTLQVRGAEGVLAGVAGTLEARVPAALDDLARPTDDPDYPGLGPLLNALEEPLEGSGHPALYATSDRFRVEPGEYPALLVVPQDTPAVRSLGDDVDGVEMFSFQYRLRIFSFVRSRSYEEVALVRNRLVLGIRVALYRRRQLADGLSVDVPGRGGIYRESYSEAVKARDGRSVGGAWQEISVTSIEGASIPAFGPVNTITVDLERLDP